MRDTTGSRGMTPNELSRLLRISPDRVRAMIARGELGALNLAPPRSSKPRYVVLPAHLEEFARRRRAATTTAKPSPRRKRQPVGWVDYYPDEPEGGSR